MTVATVPGIDHSPTSNARLLTWVREMAELTEPDRVVWCDGSAEEWDRMTTDLVNAGTFRRLNEQKKPNSFWAASDPDDVARVEERTFICCAEPAGAGPTNNWVRPRGNEVDDVASCTAGACTGARCTSSRSAWARWTRESPDARRGDHRLRVRRRLHEDHDPDGCRGAAAVRRGRRPSSCAACTRSARRCSTASRTCRGRATPTKYISHFPETREIWSYGSGYGGNALLGKKCYALRIASAIAHDEGWLAEHMLILKLISPENKAYYIAAAFPSACGKTNLAMLQPDRFPAGARRPSATTSPGCASAPTAGCTR